MIEVIMPKVDMAMTEGTIALWRYRAGEAVRAGEPLFDITTDKADVEVESPASGTLWDVRAAAGQTIQIGQPVAFILAPGEQPPDDDRTTKNEQRTTANGQRTTDKIRATPLARKLCRERGLNLAQIRGSGPSGRIGRQDVLAFLEASPSLPSQRASELGGESQPPTSNLQLRRQAREMPHSLILFSSVL